MYSSLSAFESILTLAILLPPSASSILQFSCFVWNRRLLNGLKLDSLLKCSSCAGTIVSFQCRTVAFAREQMNGAVCSLAFIAIALVVGVFAPIPPGRLESLPGLVCCLSCGFL